MYIHLVDVVDDNIRMILPPSQDGAASVVYTYTVSGLNDSRGVTFDGTHIHLADRTDQNVRMILPPRTNGAADVVYTYTVGGVNDPRGMAFDGTYVHIVSGGSVRMVLPPTQDGAATVVYTYTISGVTSIQGMTFDGTHIHLATDGDIRMILPPTQNGVASVVYTYTVSGLGDTRGVAFDGTHIHLADIDDENVRMVLPPTQDGEASTVYTYTVSGLDNPTGMTFDGGLTPPDATLSITTTDTDIRAGEVVGFNISSDVDISDFTASDIDVTGGVRGTLSMTDARNYTLAVIAGTPGTLTVAIGEDVVSPGNAAVTENFTINARISGTITFSETALETKGTTDVTITLSETPDSPLLSSSLTTSAGTLSGFSGSGTSYTATLRAPLSGSDTITVTLAADAIEAGGHGNVETTATIDYSPGTLTVAISGDTNIEQGQQTTLTATVTDANGITVENATVSWSAGRGSFSSSSGTTDANGQTSTDWTADFTESTDVNVVITASVTRSATTNPTISTASLTAMTGLGITGQILNMYISETENTPNNVITQLYVEGSSDSTLATGSDDNLSANLHIWRVQWHASANYLILNDNGTDSLDTFFRNNTTQSIYLVFSDGAYYEITNAMYDNGGDDWARWVTTSNAALTTKLDNLGADTTLLIGVGDAGSIGVAEATGSDTETVTATVASPTIATFTIATTDADIRAGELVNFDITSSIDITGFTASDIMVTGGTRGTLTSTGTRAWRLSVTAGSAGTLTIAINANAVMPGNNAISQTFTINALPTVSISFSVSTAEALEPLTVTFQWSESVSGQFATGDITLSAGTKGTFTAVDGDTYELIVTPPASGSGAIAVTVAANAVTLGNAETSESINYATTQRTFTISTTSAVIRENADFDVDIVASLPVSGLLVGEITVTGGTRGTLTETDAENYVLRVTAGAAGTLTVSIGADVVVQGNALATQNFTVVVDSNVLGIQQLGVQNIPVNTENYELPIAVTGDPDRVRGIGDWEEFYGDWDDTAGVFYIRADVVTILKAGATWRIEAAKGSDTVTSMIQHNVINSLPVIVDPGRLYFFKGIENHKFIEVSNLPASARVRGDLIGLNAGIESIESGEQGIGARGTPKETVNLSDTLSVDLYVENPAGNVSLAKAFELLDAPTLYIAAIDTTSGSTVQKIARTHKDTPNDTVAAVYPFSLANPPSSGAIRDIKHVGDFIYALYEATGSNDNLILKYAKDTVENLIGEIVETLTLPSVISEPSAFLPTSDSFFFVVDQASRRIHSLTPSAMDATVLESLLHSTLPSAYADVVGLYRDGSDTYILDSADRQIGVTTDNIASDITISFSRAFNFPSSISRARSLYVDGTYCYICNNFDATNDQKIVRFNKNTGNGQTASIDRAFDLPPNLTFPEGIFIDE